MIVRMAAALTLLLVAACASPDRSAYWSQLSTGVSQTQRKGN
jgi:hypothetical protein